MKLSSFNDGSKDGQLIVVSKDLTKFVYASDIALPISDDDLFKWFSKMSDKFGFKGGKLKVFQRGKIKRY